MPNMTISSGSPITITAADVVLGGDANGKIRADYNGLPAYINGTLNPLAFSAPPTGFYGNLGRDALHGPTTLTTSASANRTFRLADRKNLTFGLQTTNPFNHPNVSSWNTSIGNSSAQFGLPVGYVAMRSVTANVRFNF
jgi:hypothetical protein